MRELKREEYGAISGGQVTNLHTVFVDGAPSSNGTVEINTSTGLRKDSADRLCDVVGGAARLGAKADPALKLATKTCKTGVDNVIKLNDKTANALGCMEQGLGYSAAKGTCVR
jgi:hypothetical protein